MVFKVQRFTVQRLQILLAPDTPGTAKKNKKDMHRKDLIE